MLLVITKSWHGFLSFDKSAGVQKMHDYPTPRIGGISILLGLLSAVIISPSEIRHEIWPLLIAGIPAFGFGLAEDLFKRVSVTKRLFATIASGLLACLLTGYAITSVDIWGLDWLLHFTVASVMFTSFAVGGVANSINIIDGLNGLASSMVIWILLGIATLAATLGDTVVLGICLLLISSVLGFFVVNWPLGKLFLGDGGAYFMGFMLAWICVMLVERNAEVSAFAALLACIHPIFEVIYTLIRRKVHYQETASPDKLHLHSLVKRIVMKRLLPHSGKIMRNSVSGLLVGGISLAPAFLVQWVYSSTLACLALVIAFGLIYVLLYLSLLKYLKKRFPRKA